MTYYMINHISTADRGPKRTKRSRFYRVHGEVYERLTTNGEGWVSSRTNKKKLDKWLLRPDYWRIKQLDDADDIFLELI
jgi:hypothetical protein